MSNGVALASFDIAVRLVLLPIQESLKEKIEMIGRAIAERYEIVGAWGIDFFIRWQATFWPVDFNIRLNGIHGNCLMAATRTQGPRTIVLSISMFSRCLGNLDMRRLKRATDLAGLESDPCFGKSILFNDGDEPIRITEAVHRQLVFEWRLINELESGQIGVADIPNEGRVD